MLSNSKTTANIKTPQQRRSTLIGGGNKPKTSGLNQHKVQAKTTVAQPNRLSSGGNKEYNTFSNAVQTPPKKTIGGMGNNSAKNEEKKGQSSLTKTPRVTTAPLYNSSSKMTPQSANSL